jgi:hypothetical protein
VAYGVLSECVSPLLDHRPDLQNQRSYTVESPVSEECFQGFVAAVRQGSEVVVDSGNVGDLTLLSGEFCLEDLREKCAGFAGSGWKRATDFPFGDLECELRQAVEGLSSRVGALESEKGEVRRGWEDALRQLKERQVQEVKGEVQALKDSLRPMQVKRDEVPLLPLVKVEFPMQGKLVPLVKLEIPMKEANSLQGIISYLTKKHGGNVHEKGIVTIVSKSIDPDYYPLKSVADLTSDSWFVSKDEPDQWVYWDFCKMRVRPTHYTIVALSAWMLKSWVVEGSLDGKRWTEIDRQTNNQDFKDDYATASFAVSKPAECRFIRLTQTDKNHRSDDCLVLVSVEFFGTLSE